MTGTIDRVVEGRGFGFIRPRGTSGDDVFFHARDLPGDLIFGEQLRELEVHFSVVEGPKGKRAIDIRKAMR